MGAGGSINRGHSGRPPHPPDAQKIVACWNCFTEVKYGKAVFASELGRELGEVMAPNPWRKNTSMQILFCSNACLDICRRDESHRKIARQASTRLKLEVLQNNLENLEAQKPLMRYPPGLRMENYK